MARVQDHRMWIGCYENFTPVAEVARIHQTGSEKLVGCSTIPATEGHCHCGFQRDSPLETVISATLVLIEIASSPPVLSGSTGYRFARRADWIVSWRVSVICGVLPRGCATVSVGIGHLAFSRRAFSSIKRR